MDNNNFFTHEDEWFLLYGAPLTKKEAESFSKLQWRLTKEIIQKEKEKMNLAEKGGVFWKDFRFKYYGLLWKYQELIKLNKLKPNEKEDKAERKPLSFKKPKF